MFEGPGFAGLTFVLKRWCDFGVIFKQPVPTTTLDCYVLSVTVLWVVSDIILPPNLLPSPLLVSDMQLPFSQLVLATADFLLPMLLVAFYRLFGSGEYERAETDCMSLL